MKTVVTNSDVTWNLEAKYVIGGLETTYRGLGGDEFRSSVRWDASSLIFDTIDQEGSNDIPQKAVWTLSADGNARLWQFGPDVIHLDDKRGYRTSEIGPDPIVRLSDYTGVRTPRLPRKRVRRSYAGLFRPIKVASDSRLIPTISQ